MFSVELCLLRAGEALMMEPRCRPGVCSKKNGGVLLERWVPILYLFQPVRVVVSAFVAK